jgi:protein TonB
MKLDESGAAYEAAHQASGVTPVVRFYREDPSAWSRGEILRLFLVPTVVTLLFVGGVYWVRLQRPAGTVGQDQASIVQVHLLPRPDPAAIPVAAASQPVVGNVASRTDVPAEEPDPSTRDATAMVPPATTPTETSAPSIEPTPSPSPSETAPNSAAIKFQQALLRHVARYEHYPNGARPGRLHGSVETLFSMRRDGTLAGVWVKTSSGQAMLDKAAMDTIRRAEPLPSIPSQLPDRLNIQMVLVFDPP